MREIFKELCSKAPHYVSVSKSPDKRSSTSVETGSRTLQLLPLEQLLLLFYDCSLLGSSIAMDYEQVKGNSKTNSSSYSRPSSARTANATSRQQKMSDASNKTRQRKTSLSDENDLMESVCLIEVLFSMQQMPGTLGITSDSFCSLFAQYCSIKVRT